MYFLTTIYQSQKYGKGLITHEIVKKDYGRSRAGFLYQSIDVSFSFSHYDYWHIPQTKEWLTARELEEAIGDTDKLPYDLYGISYELFAPGDTGCGIADFMNEEFEHYLETFDEIWEDKDKPLTVLMQIVSERHNTAGGIEYDVWLELVKPITSLEPLA